MPGGRETALRIVALLVALCLALLVGIRAATPPAVVPASAPVAVFSAERAMADIHAVAVRPHPTASTDNARVRAYLLNRLRALGLQVEERRYLIDPRGLARLRGWEGGVSTSTEMTNLIGILPGRNHALPAIAMMAHYDTVWGSPGSGDDSIGLATVLETLRAIKAQGQPERDILVLFTDGEEIGLQGARAFWPSDALAGHVGAVVNMEARGTGGRATMFETGAGNGGMIALFGRSVAHPVANSIAVLAYRHMPNGTDFTPALARGVPGFNFAILGRAAYYHSPLATVDRLDPRSLQDMGDQVLGLVSGLAAARVLPGRAPDAVFFDVAGHGLVHYAAGTGWWLLAAAAAALGVAWAGVALVGRVRPVEVLHGALAQLWLAAHGVLAFTVLDRLTLKPHPDYYDRLAALPRLEMVAGLAGLAVLIGFLMLRRFPHRVAGLLPALGLALLGWMEGAPQMLILSCAVVGMLAGWFAQRGGVSRWGGWLGGIGLLLLMAIAGQAMEPVAAWIVAWPALVLAVAAMLVGWTDPAFRQPWGWAFAIVGAVAVSAPLLPLAHLAFLSLGEMYPQAMVVVLAILAVTFWPLAKIERWHSVCLLAVVALLAGAGVIAVHVRGAPLAGTVPAYASDK